jgi:peptidoglycan/LPS O-acetylase OafA/YrhL
VHPPVVPARSSPPAYLALPSRIPSLDGLRALSIALVLIGHALMSFKLRGAGRDVAAALGGMGVSVFFVISGFLITHLLLREQEKTGEISLRDFYVRRTFRIWPAFYFFLLVCFVLQRSGIIELPTISLLYAGAYVWNYAPAATNTWLGHTWSLAVEEQFYLFWPLVVIGLGRRRAIGVSLAILLLSPIVRGLTLALLDHDHFLVHRMWMTAHTRFDTIMIGCLASLLWRVPAFHAALGAMFRAKLQHGALAFFLLGSAPLRTLVPWYHSVVGYSVEAVCIVLIMLWSVQRTDTPWARLLNCAPLVHLGVISYSVYLWQQIFLNEKNLSWTGILPISLICTLAAAEFSFFCIERPALRLRERFLTRAPVHADVPDEALALA